VETSDGEEGSRCGIEISLTGRGANRWVIRLMRASPWMLTSLFTAGAAPAKRGRPKKTPAEA